MKMASLLRYISSSLWFVPVVCVVGGAAISFGTIAIDRQETGVEASFDERDDIATALTEEREGIGVSAWAR